MLFLFVFLLAEDSKSVLKAHRMLLIQQCENDDKNDVRLTIVNFYNLLMYESLFFKATRNWIDLNAYKPSPCIMSVA